MRRSELPIVTPKPRSNGSATNLPYVPRQRFDVADDLAGQFQSTPANMHKNLRLGLMAKCLVTGPSMP